VQVAAELEDPEAMVVVILPDGGRSYLSKVFSDAWMQQHGFLERDHDLLVGDVLAHKLEAGQTPTFVSIEADHPVREAVSLLHQHGLSQLPVISAGNGGHVIGAVGERGLLRHAASNPALLDETIEQVMEPPFPAVSVDDPARAAVELLVGDQQALLVTRDGTPEGIVTRTDLLEALAT
jgi:cystathionine beta-synthase